MSRSLAPPPATSFNGRFADFYLKHIEPNLPSPAAVRALHELLVTYVRDDASELFVTRRFDGRPRGIRLPAGASNLFVVCGDNEPALWFYARAFLEDHGQRIVSVAQAIERRAFPIGFARKTAVGESKDFWPNWGKEAWENGSFSGIRLYHAHLFDAADRVPSLTLDRKNLTLRMIRFLHPANHVPMPTHHGSDSFTSGGNSVDLSELPGIKRYVCEQYAHRYREVWAEFLALAGADPSQFPRVDDLHFECTRSAGFPGVAIHVTQAGRFTLGEIRRTATRFRVDERMYEDLLAAAGPLVIFVDGGTGRKVHPTGTYEIPRAEALSFIESKRVQPNWHTHGNFHSVSIPAELRAYFRHT